MFELARGQTLNQRFTLIRPLGKGGMGDVWLVEDRELEERLVAKIVPANAAEEQLALLRRECRHARKLVHPNIVQVYDFLRGDDVSFLTMAYVEGTDIGRFRGAELGAILDLLIPIADALHHAHLRGVVHRDLKVANVVVDGAGIPHLLDFGIAGLLDADSDGVASGGGTEDSASPQQRSGHRPSAADDIHAFGMLLRELAPQPFPEKLEQYAGRMLSVDPHQRPRDMSEVKRALEEIRTSTSVSPPPRKPVHLTPPPRVAEVTPGDVSPAPIETSPPEKRAGGVGWKTLLAFGASFALAGVVFFALPSWVEEARSRPEPEVAAPVAVETEQLSETPDLSELAGLKTSAERARARAEEIRSRLDTQRVTSWGNEGYRAAVEKIDEGVTLMASRSYAPSSEVFEQAASELETLASRASTVAKEAFDRGQRALASGDAVAAEEGFALALAIQPKSAAARTGLARARVLDEVLGLISRGEAIERSRNSQGAVADYRRAAELDPLSGTAQKALARIDAHASGLAFTAAMSDGMAALSRREFAAAREAFERAKAMRPESRDVRDGLDRAEEGLRLQTIAGHRDKALDLEKRESWRKAEAEYDAVLALDRTIRFAQGGKERTSTRGVLDEKLGFHLSQATRLSDREVRAEAARVLGEATAIEPKGPKLQKQVERLEALVRTYSTPVDVLLLSDEKTEVVIYKVGRLGTFEQHSLTLTPGTYTVVGSRQGFRDVRHQLVVSTERRPEPLMIRCTEEI